MVFLITFKTLVGVTCMCLHCLFEGCFSFDCCDSFASALNHKEKSDKYKRGPKYLGA